MNDCNLYFYEYFLLFQDIWIFIWILFFGKEFFYCILYLIFHRYFSMLLYLTAGLGQLLNNYCLQAHSALIHRPYVSFTHLKELHIFPGICFNGLLLKMIHSYHLEIYMYAYISVISVSLLARLRNWNLYANIVSWS